MSRDDCAAAAPKYGVGSVVKFHESNGEVSPAIVTKVWGSNCYNIKVLPDGRSPFDATSVSIGDHGYYIVE